MNVTYLIQPDTHVAINGLTIVTSSITQLWAIILVNFEALVLCTVINLFFASCYPTSHPFTAVDCPALAPIPNGAIAYDPDTIAPFDEGTVATHTCNEGFMLGAGSETRTCLETGRWSGFTPVCRGM